MTTTKGGGLNYCTWKVRCYVLVKQFALSRIGIFIFSTLPLHILFDTFFIQANRTDTVVSRPQMLAPGPLAQVRITVKKLQGQFSLQKPHELRHRILGRYRDHQMDMVWLNIDGDHFYTIFLVTESVDLLSDELCHIILQYVIPIFWTEHDMILAFIQ